MLKKEYSYSLKQAFGRGPTALVLGGGGAEEAAALARALGGYAAAAGGAAAVVPRSELAKLAFFLYFFFQILELCLRIFGFRSWRVPIAHEFSFQWEMNASHGSICSEALIARTTHRTTRNASGPSSVRI